MNSCTMALKLVVSVVRTVVGALLEALDLFLEFLTTFSDPDEGLGRTPLSDPDEGFM